MPLTPTEAIALSDEVIALAASIADAVAPDSPEGKKVSKTELRVILQQAAELSFLLAKEVVD